MAAASRLASTASRLACYGLMVLLMVACDVFQPRDPETPDVEGGTFVQPDTPEQVIENLRNAISELNTLNYRRSLAEDLTFTPTASAQAQSPIWSSWSRAEEERYFSTMVAAAAQRPTGHSLTLNDQQLTVLGPQETLLDATYVLTVNHARPDVSTSVQGRLVWRLTQSEDGLWSLREWTDQQIGDNPSWSALKAAFSQ